MNDSKEKIRDWQLELVSFEFWSNISLIFKFQAQLEQEQHEIRKESATKEHLEARIEELSKESAKGATENDQFEIETSKAREMVKTKNFFIF